jgi:hypothetical protein
MAGRNTVDGRYRRPRFLMVEVAEMNIREAIPHDTPTTIRAPSVDADIERSTESRAT